MAWIKRNLFFVLGSLAALALMVVGVIMLLSQIAGEQRVADEIQSKYTTLTELNNKKPHPGAGAIDNIAAAKEQTAELRAYIAKISKVFQPIAPIPDLPPNRISNREFATQLLNTISQLRRSAEQQGVVLSVPDYAFTFYSQKIALNFDAASLGPLSSHLGEVKALADILFEAKINSLDSIRREVVSTSDTNMPDYLAQKTVTNLLAELTPYEVTFKCFSGELAQVLAGLAGSPHGFVVKTINITPTFSAAGEVMTSPAMLMTAPMIAPPISPRNSSRMRGGFLPAPGMAPVMAPPVSQPPAAPRGPQEFLIEKPVQVTLLLQVVKIKPVPR